MSTGSPSRQATAGFRQADPFTGGSCDLLLARLLDLTSQPFTVLDLDGRFLRVNRAFEALVDYPADELLAMNFNDLTPEHARGQTEPHLQRLLQTGEPQRYEKSYRRRDGQEVPIEAVVELIRDAAGHPVGFYAFVTDIAARKRAEQALRASEERLRSLFDEAPIGYHTIDTEGTIVEINQTECDLLGYSREEMLGRPIFDFIEESARAQARAAVHDRIHGKQPVMSVERVYRTKDGRLLQVFIENRLVRDEHGQIVGIRSTVQDITWRKQAEAALISSDRRSRALLEGIEDAVFVHDLQGRLLDANPAASRQLGYSREEFLRMTTREIDAPEFASGFEDRLEAQLRQGHLRIEGRHRARDGRIIPVDINTSTIQLEDQTVVLAVSRDITERKALEETRRQFAEAQLRNAREIETKNRALIESEARYRQLTEGSLDAIVVTDRAGRITLFNPAAERTFHYTAAEALGMPLENLLAPGERPRLRDGLRASVEGADPRAPGSLVGRTVELRGLRKGGEEFPLEVSLGAAEIAGQIQLIGAIRDQTERQRLRAVLAQSERLASIGVLAAGVAHEINNPLSFIGNNLAVLQRDLAGLLELVAAYQETNAILAVHAPEALARVVEIEDSLDWEYVRDNLSRMLNRTRDGVQRVANIVQSLRGAARSEPKFEAVSLADLIAAALDMVRGRLRHRHIEVRTELAPLEKLLCVPTQLGQVLLNLLVNAIQAIETCDRDSGNLIRIRTRGLSNSQEIEIADNGCGISPETMTHLFDPFYTTKPVGEGTGLGLSITHEIISAHGGRIEVESAANQGTTFRILLPWQAAPPPSVVPADPLGRYEPASPGPRQEGDVPPDS